MNTARKMIAAVVTAGAMALGLAGCGKQAATDGKTVRLAYVNWAEGVAMTHLAQAILEDRMGYTVRTTMADVAPVFASVATGDNDAFLEAWEPITHEMYLRQYKDDIVDIGVIYEGARIGLVVPDYVRISSIAELPAARARFNGRIVGIDSGAGIMEATEKAIQEYGLNYRLVPSSGPAMTASLKNAIDKQEPIIVTGWKPHWMFARWKLKFLDDPKGVYGQAETIHVIARKGLEEDQPEVAALLRNMRFNDAQLDSLMDVVERTEGQPLEGARQWMAQNEELINSWVPAAAPQAPAP